jgi:DNA-binding HxlR family transcriptional regulator
MVSVKKRLKKLSKRQDELERAIRDIKPKRLRKLVRRLTKKGRGKRLPAVLSRRTAS